MTLLVSRLYRAVINIKPALVLMAALTTPTLAEDVASVRGQQLFMSGRVDHGREPQALIGAASTPAAAKLVPCASCHGRDAEGRPEGAIRPPDISWRNLTRADGHVHLDGHAHAAYDAASFGRALTRGVDPADHHLDPVMPRYDFSDDELSDLVAFLKVVDSNPAPGVDANTIKLGILLPPDYEQQEISDAVRATLQSVFDDENAHGGVYNRMIRIAAPEKGDMADQMRRNVEDLGRNAFAFLSVGTSKTAGAIRDVAEKQQIPNIDAMTLLPQEEGAGRYNFYIFSGWKTQLRILIDHAAASGGATGAQPAVLYPKTQNFEDIASAIGMQAAANNWRKPLEFAYGGDGPKAEDYTRALRENGADPVLFLGEPDDLLRFLRAADSQGWRPHLLLPGSLVSAALFNAPASFAGRISLSFPYAPSDWTKEGRANFLSLAGKMGAARHHLAARLAAYCAAKLMLRALKLTGRRLTREGFVASLESLRDFETGVTRPLSYGPNQRVASPGAYVVTLDLANRRFARASDWMTAK